MKRHARVQERARRLRQLQSGMLRGCGRRGCRFVSDGAWEVAAGLRSVLNALRRGDR